MIRSDALNAELTDLVGSAAGGDQAAWDALVDRFSGLVWTVARNHRLGDADAAEVCQTTWLRLVEHIDTIADPPRIGAWLATTARREALRVLRLSGRQIPMGDELPEQRCDAPAPDAAILMAERDAGLWDAFGRLPARDQALLRLLSADPAPSYETVAASLGMPVGSVGPTRGRCLERLRREVNTETISLV